MKKYTFILDCVDHEACMLIRSKMRDENFDEFETLHNDFGGDHKATKLFTSRKASQLAAKKLFADNKKNIHQIAVE